MAEKGFWSWLSIGRDGQPIEGESGGGQQYFATNEHRKSFFWAFAYRFSDLAVCVIMLPLLIVRAAIEEIDRYACRFLDWLQRKAG